MAEKKENNKEELKESNKNSDEIIELKKIIDSQKIELAETDDRLKRVAAEFDNYK